MLPAHQQDCRQAEKHPLHVASPAVATTCMLQTCTAEMPSVYVHTRHSLTSAHWHVMIVGASTSVPASPKSKQHTAGTMRQKLWSKTLLLVALSAYSELGLLVPGWTSHMRHQRHGLGAAASILEENTQVQPWPLIDKQDTAPSTALSPLKQPQGDSPLTRGFASMRLMAWMVLPRPIRSNSREPDGI